MSSSTGDSSLVAVPTSLGRRILEEPCPPKICHVPHCVAHCDLVARQVAMPCVLDGAGEQPLHVDEDFEVGTVCVVGLVLRGVTGTRFIAGTHQAELFRNDDGRGLFHLHAPRYNQQTVMVHDSAVVWDRMVLHGGPSGAAAHNYIMVLYTVVMKPLSPAQLAHVAEVSGTLNY